MDPQALRAAATAIEYIEAHLTQRPRLDEVAAAVHYSKYHLHRVFAGVTGVPVCQYIRRRQLTRGAELLASTRRPILEIAQETGYDSQRAFSAAFRGFYKRTPGRFREEGCYYPLQLAVLPGGGPSGRGLTVDAARFGDIPGWMELAARVVGGFPHFEETAHRAELEDRIQKGQALVLRDGEMVAGTAVFSPESGEIGFFAVHPQYRGQGGGRALLEEVERRTGPGRRISITTFREGDRADPGQRAACRGLGFLPGELLIQYGYPTQRFLLPGEGSSWNV